MTTRLSRRRLLGGFGAALAVAACPPLPAADPPAAAGPLTPRAPHHAAKAKACIVLYMAGGPSHIDTFDPKPKLDQLHGTTFTRKDRFASAMASGERAYTRSPFRFRQVGGAGLWMCEHFQALASVADDLCLYRGCQAESINHPTANYHMNTGSQFGGDPAFGAWVTYGLGSRNQDLPGFVVLPEVNFPQGGTRNWSNGFLPAHYQGTPLRAVGSPILDLAPPPWVRPEAQGADLALLAALNAEHAAARPGRDELAARAAAYDLALRMQKAVPAVIDLEREDQRTRDEYGIGKAATDSFGRRCLLARRLVEAGVRCVQLYSDGWDSHDFLDTAHAARIAAIDRPMTALIADLKRRGLLEQTLVVWGGEFGRSPDNQKGRGRVGRDHNAKGMAILLAGGGVRRGAIVGATDETGAEAVECAHPIRDLHVTLLHLMGLDDNRLTYLSDGRHKQLSQIGGQVIKELLA